MSRLDELIRELCLNGVECCSISEIATISRGRVISKEYIKENIGSYPVYSSQTENNGELGKILTYDYDGEYVTWTTDGANAGSVFYRNGKFSVTNVCGLIKCKTDVILPKYLFYSLSKNAKAYVNSGMGNPKLMSNVMGKIKIPVPPLEIQYEIVRMLDSFTLLTAELTAELTARKLQYEYYRDTLLTYPKESTKFMPFGDLFDVRNGLNKGKEFFGQGVPIVNFTDVYNKRWLAENSLSGRVDVTPDEIERFSAKKGDVFFTRTSETKEDIGMVSTLIEDVEDCVFSGFVLRARPKTNLLNPKFCSYYFSSTMIRKEIIRYASFTTRATTTGEKLSKLMIPILPMEKQERIVQILENFESICSDLNIGLPAEISARQKQYEYYRDALLTYAATGNMLDRQTDRQTDRQNLIRLIQYVFGCVSLPLKDIANVFRGEYITKKDAKPGNIPVILGGQEPAYYIDQHNHEGEITVIARSGASAGFVSYWNQPIFVTDGFGYEAKDDVISDKYLYYILKNKEKEFNSMKRGAGVPHVSGEALGNIRFNIPLKREQERIVSILERFDTLCNDLSSGLPAEIEARQKQYEYYRDKLLSFKPLNK